MLNSTFKRYTLMMLAGLIVWLAPMHAQNYKQVINNPLYYWGEGYGVTLEEADKQALSSLMSSISVNVISGFDINNIREEKNGQLVEDRTISEGIIKTYSAATLSNTSMQIVKNQPDAHVVRWILKSEVDKVFASRKDKVIEYINAAIRAENQGKVDDALRSYYWALALTKTMQYPNDVSYSLKNEYNEVIDTPKVMVWVPEQMEQIFDAIKIKAVKRVKDDVELYITYKDKPVSSIDYTYFDGRSWTPICGAKDGVGTLELAAGNSSNTYDISVEFEYRSQSCIDPELDAVLNAVTSSMMPKQLFRSANMTVKSAREQNASPVNITYNSARRTETSNDRKYSPPQQLKNTKLYAETIIKILDAVQKKNYSGVEMFFTADGADIYRRLLTYGNAKVVGTPQLNFYKNRDKIVCRGVQMVFSFENGARKQFVEDVVFTFNSNGKIEALAFGLGKIAEDDILNNGWWKEEVRVAIMEFLENYKTAYALERLDYIEGVFDKDAIIVIGTVLKRPNTVSNADQNILLSENQVVYKTHTKMEYLTNLRRVFKQNEFINIRFSNNKVKKMGIGGETYAIQIAQDYYSSRYGDKGYLFLMVDLNNPEQPTIKVRTWQPKADMQLGGDGIIGLDDF
ncbi:MAG: LPP20 family lipoprotein [Bacteroidaceae bacterium]|nr:LPP20 family lipoprotein [Bacteroidaceae bacterium]